MAIGTQFVIDLNIILQAPGESVSQYFASVEPNCRWLFAEKAPIGRYLQWYGEFGELHTLFFKRALHFDFGLMLP